VAHFAAGYSIAAFADPPGGGLVTCPAIAPPGARVTLHADEHPGYTFSHWTNETGATVGAEEEYGFILHAPAVLTAHFMPETTICTECDLSGAIHRRIVWPADADGWTLRESANLLDWSDSALPLSIRDGHLSAEIDASDRRCFFRLERP
jgi:hypothetical protein